MRDQSTYDQSLGVVIFDATELRDFLYIDQSPGLIESLLHQNREMGPTGKNLRFAGVLFEQRAGFSDRRRFEVIEVSHDGLWHIAYSVWRNAYGFIYKPYAICYMPARYTSPCRLREFPPSQSASALSSAPSHRYPNRR